MTYVLRVLQLFSLLRGTPIIKKKIDWKNSGKTWEETYGVINEYVILKDYKEF